MTVIELDSNATTRPSREVVEAVTDTLTGVWHNPSSVHRSGQAARRGIELARQSIARLIGARPREITFTSGATESILLAVLGTMRAFAGSRLRIVTTATEHEAVHRACDEAKLLHRAEVIEVPVSREGIVDLDALAAAVDDAPALVSIHGVNNETGAIQPIADIGRLCRGRGSVFHCDATQWVGRLPFDVGALPVDLVSFSGHKFHGIKGGGGLWAHRSTRLAPLIPGTQELGRRGGTENAPGIIAMGVAAELARDWLADPALRDRGALLRDRLERGILDAVEGAVVNGPRDPKRRTWNTTNIGFPTLEAEALLMLLSERGVNASAGAACSSGSLDPSPVLLAMGIPEAVAHGSIRLSLSRETTQEEIDRAIAIIVESVCRLGRTGA